MRLQIISSNHHTLPEITLSETDCIAGCGKSVTNNGYEITNSYPSSIEVIIDKSWLTSLISTKKNELANLSSNSIVKLTFLPSEKVRLHFDCPNKQKGELGITQILSIIGNYKFLVKQLPLSKNEKTKISNLTCYICKEPVTFDNKPYDKYKSYKLYRIQPSETENIFFGFGRTHKAIQHRLTLKNPHNPYILFHKNCRPRSVNNNRLMKHSWYKGNGKDNGIPIPIYVYKAKDERVLIKDVLLQLDNYPEDEFLIENSIH